MKDIVIVDARQTAVGQANKGTLRHTRPDDIAATVVKTLVENQPNLDPERIGDVIIGCAMPESEQGMNVGRNIALLAGLPVSVPGMTVNRFCSSGLETINLAALKIAAGQAEAVGKIVAKPHRWSAAFTLLDPPRTVPPVFIVPHFPGATVFMDRPRSGRSRGRGY